MLTILSIGFGLFFIFIIYKIIKFYKFLEKINDVVEKNYINI